MSVGRKLQSHKISGRYCKTIFLFKIVQKHLIIKISSQKVTSFAKGKQIQSFEINIFVMPNNKKYLC